MLLAPAACSASNGDRGDAGSPGPAEAGASVDAAATAGPQQYTFVMDSFDVPADTELYECQDVPNPFGKDIAIVHTESTMSLGAHHMFAFQIPAGQAAFAPDGGIPPVQMPDDASPAAVSTYVPDGGKTPLFDCPAGGLEFHPYFHLTQKAHDVTTYPAGVGRSLKATEAIRLNVHYLNASAASVRVNAEITVTYEKAHAVKQLAAGIFVYANSLQVPTGASTQSFSYPVTADLKFLQVTGHMHRRGLHYEAHATSATTGAVRPLYSSDTWDEPVALELAQPFPVSKGDTIDYSCTYENDTGATLTYGESAATNEMCNFFGVFYPAVDGTGLLGAL
jgi:hypothetical protein